MRPLFKLVTYTLFILFIGCRGERTEEIGNSTVNVEEAMFEYVPSSMTGVLFNNYLDEGLNTNILMYEYFYNGGGVVTADFNSDGWIDLYFTANMSDCKLYLNDHNFSFRDVSTKAGVAGRPGPWKTGATVVDINSDGLPDIYLSYSGAMPEEKRKNQLFVNKGNDADGIPQFEDMAEAYGLDSPAFTNQAYFFDFDKNGSLEVLLLNHNPKNLPLLNESGTAELFNQDSPEMGLRYFVKEGEKYVDKTRAFGINGSVLSYGLGLGVGDFNNDGWYDFYVSNDYAVPDYVYINKQGKGFANEISTYLGHNSQFSMGNDVADINNDGMDDIVTLDMLPRDEKRQKLLMAPDNYNKYEENKRSGFHDQLMRNMLQVNTGNGRFSEIGQITGISNTDWSWAPLIADYDNDGFKDLYITNGYLRDYTNLDFINYMENYVASKGRLQREDVLEIINNMPASDIENQLFQNNGSGQFSNVTTSWGIGQPSNSNGAAYADLDNDGDLDLIVNNINKEAFIMKNLVSEKKQNKYLQIQLKGNPPNVMGIGCRVVVHSGGSQQSMLQMPTRAYLSSVSPILHFGLNQGNADSIEVFWNSGKYQVVNDVAVNSRIIIEEQGAGSGKNPTSRFASSTFKLTACLDFVHQQEDINDYNRQPMLFSSPSYFGPCMASADFNLDGKDDLIIGGGKDQPASLYLSEVGGNFKKILVADFEKDKAFANASIVTGDFNGDGFPDVFIVSGGYGLLATNDPVLSDRLYFGNGKGGFTRSTTFNDDLPSDNRSTLVLDANADGKDDILTFGGYIPGRYPEVAENKLYTNSGNGSFQEKFNTTFPNWEKNTRITDVKWADLDNDGKKELILVGLWTKPKIFVTENGKWVDKTEIFIDTKSLSGLWNTVTIADLNADKIPDLVLGNLGLNSQLHASLEEPLSLYFGDVDKNGSVDPILTYYNGGKAYPFASRDEMMGQLPKLKQKFNSYEKFAEAQFTDVFSKDIIDGLETKSVAELRTVVLLSQSGNKKYQLTQLPIEAQYAPVHLILTSDFNKDGHNDLLLFGNDEKIKLRLGKMDANQGVLLLNDGKGLMKYISQQSSGLNVAGDVRGGLILGNRVLLGVNDKKVLCYEIQ